MGINRLCSLARTRTKHCGLKGRVHAFKAGFVKRESMSGGNGWVEWWSMPVLKHMTEWCLRRSGCNFCIDPGGMSILGIMTWCCLPRGKASVSIGPTRISILVVVTWPCLVGGGCNVFRSVPIPASMSWRLYIGLHILEWMRITVIALNKRMLVEVGCLPHRRPNICIDTEVVSMLRATIRRRTL